MIAQRTITSNNAREIVRVGLELSKPRVTLLLVFTAFAAAVVAARGAPDPARVALLLAAGIAACAGAAWINHYLDRDIDARMARTRLRPLPSGRANPVAVVWIGIALIATGVRIALFVNPTVAWFVLFGALCYVTVYTAWLKRRTAWNIVIGGAAGSFAALAGWATAQPALSPSAGLLALLLFLWTPPHFWSLAMVYGEEYRRAGVPALPVIVGARKCAWVILGHAVAIVIASLFLIGSGATRGWVYPGVVTVAGASFVLAAIRLVYDPRPRQAWKTYKVSSVYLGVLLLAMMLDAIL
ncbi:MAG: protoheme IX farnesyltransferase [Chloroflexi bacterium]|nr:protoheme IX farnesyltransferase [Chloroflexota bacterium]